MTTQTEALKLALEALEWSTSCMSFDDFDDMPEALEELNKVHQAITAIKEALAQPEQEQHKQEPVATVVEHQYEDGSHAGNLLEWSGRNEANDLPVGTKLYTDLPKRKPLTDEQRREILKDNTIQGYQGDYFDAWGIIDDVEAAHGIKE